MSFISVSTKSLVETLAQLPVHSMSINDLLWFRFSHRSPSALDDIFSPKRITSQQLIASASFLQKELPIRLAHRLHDFFRLPHAAVANSHIHQVYEMHLKAFRMLHDVGTISTTADEEHFAHTLEGLINEHFLVVPLMQEGLLELRIDHPDIELNSFLDRLFYTRIGNRLGAAHHLALHGQTKAQEEAKNDSDDFIGIIHQRFHPKGLADSLVSNIQKTCQRLYGITPKIHVKGDSSLQFPYIPEHIRFILFEALKNSVRATVEFHGETEGGLSDSEKNLPDVIIEVCRGVNDMIIKVSDKGGGVVEDILPHIWGWGYSTAHAHAKESIEKEREEKMNSSGDSSSQQSQNMLSIPCQLADSHLLGLTSLLPMSRPGRREFGGYGFGLPLSRIYARYFGGNLELISMPGVGTDVYITVPRLGFHETDGL